MLEQEADTRLEEEATMLEEEVTMLMLEEEADTRAPAATRVGTKAHKMTVGGVSGDSGGDLATPTPARVLKGSDGVCSPEWLSGSRFWMLQSSDEDEEGEEEGSSSAGESDKPVRYLCRTPSPVGARDLFEDSTELARRTLKRIKQRNGKRMAAKAAMELTTQEGMASPFSLSQGKNSGKNKIKTMPVMEPSVFMDDNTEGWTVVRRRRWSPAIARRSQDPRKTAISKFRGMGLVRMRDGANSNLDHCGPNFARQGVSISSRTNGDRVPRQAKVGNAVAGRAFRSLLGLAWKKIETGEPVVRRRRLVNSMNGDGGQGGFNPGRGVFNAGRGGYQGRGGYGNGHGANAARGRQNLGGARGGHGYGVGRGFQGNAGNTGFGGGRNFVHGESSGTAGMGSGHQEENWGGSNANFQRSANFNNGNRFGYGGNQQRWNTSRGGGFQNRFRANGTGAAARNGIDADLLQQTVQAVVAAVTAATKISEPAMATVPQVATVSDGLAGGTSQHAAKVENPKLAKVTIDGDAMTIPEIIEQLKKIVPSEKFNWQVFHFRENVFRVKLPNKQEVQRLKNFGTYICTDRESCLTFDLWSSLEEPLYTLPEVWVRVSELPTYIRSDYLSLWGVGTLFGKTLDVDMAYTRNNKVLRTKIGYLDRNLIPADSDVFIRRGLFKLRFEVETAQGSQEVNMVEANNGNDGNDDAHHGEANNSGGNAMDMDPKGTDEGATSNNNGQDGSYENNGVDGMQQIDLGIAPVGVKAVRLVADRTELHVPAAAARPLADNQLRMPAHAGLSVPTPLSGSQRAVQQTCSSMQAGDRWAAATCERISQVFPHAGSAVAGAAGSTAPGATPTPQKIRRGGGGGPAPGMHANSNDQAMIANDGRMIGADCGGSLGSSVPHSDMGKVYCSLAWLVRWNNQRMPLGKTPLWLRKKRLLELVFKV
ncbi:hypothetical protein ACQ4PT_066356 [Festuca glaucescens]